MTKRKAKKQVAAGEFKPFKGRTPQVGAEVFVYRNLKNDLWSVRDTATGLVVCHAPEVFVVAGASEVCIFDVNEAGRQRVLATQEKNVHAGVCGRLAGFSMLRLPFTTEVTYNPYKYSSFVQAATEQPAMTSEAVYLREDKRVWGCAVQ